MLQTYTTMSVTASLSLHLATLEELIKRAKADLNEAKAEVEHIQAKIKAREKVKAAAACC